MSRPVIQDLESLRHWLRQHESAPRPIPREVVPSGLETLDAMLPGGGFPRGGMTVLRGRPGTGRMSVAGALVAKETSEGRAVAWVDGRGTLYPPGLSLLGVRLERLLIVRPKDEVRAMRAAEQIVDAGVFGVVVASGVDDAIEPTRARRIQMASRGARVCVLFLLEPSKTLPHSQLVLGLQRLDDRIVVEAERCHRGRPGAKASLPIEVFDGLARRADIV